MRPQLAMLALFTALAAGCTGDDGEMATSTISFRFGGEDGRSDITATVVSDLSKRPTKDAYEDAGLEPRRFYTVHDQLEDWSRQSGKSYVAQNYTFGFMLTEVDGVTGDDNEYWALEVNEIAVSKGMSDLQLEDGDFVEWMLSEFDDDVS